MIRLSQRDLKWAAVKLGATNLTVGRWGCTTTSISMLSDFFGCYTDPKKIALEAKHYTMDGLVLWKTMNFKKMRFVVREYGRKDKNIQAALKDPDMGVLLEVNKGQHWVLAVKANKTGYTVVDPFMGDDCDVIKRYHNITGAAYFERA